MRLGGDFGIDVEAGASGKKGMQKQLLGNAVERPPGSGRRRGGRSVAGKERM